LSDPPIAIGSRLARFQGILTLGLRPNFGDYPPAHQALIRRAHTIYFPTNAYAAQFAAMGKRIFPSLESHLYESDKIKQTALLNVFGLAHPRTRVFWGRQCREIIDYFTFPFVAKTPRGSAKGRGVFLIRDQAELDRYLANNHPAYIQEWLEIDRDIRVVVIGFEPVCSYWRVAPDGGWITNVARGGRVVFGGVPGSAVELAVEAARLANFDDVGVDVVMRGGEPMILEFNFKYGTAGPRQAGIDLRAVLAAKILDGCL